MSIARQHQRVASSSVSVQRCTRRKMAYPCRAAIRLVAQLAIVHSHAFWKLVVWDNWVDSTDRYRTAKLVMAKMS